MFGLDVRPVAAARVVCAAYYRQNRSRLFLFFTERFSSEHARIPPWRVRKVSSSQYSCSKFGISLEITFDSPLTLQYTMIDSVAVYKLYRLLLYVYLSIFIDV